jgi:hypothetical protein
LALTEPEFIAWIDAGHTIFNHFEGRNDAYPLARKWSEQWLVEGEIHVEKPDLERVRSLMREFDPSMFSASRAIGKALVESFSELVETHLSASKTNIGLGLAPLLFTWNFRRYKTYAENGWNVGLPIYFRALGDYLTQIRPQLKTFSSRDFFDKDEPKPDLKDLFTKINERLKHSGIGQNETVGTVKLLHVMFPSLLPLIDNPIASALGLKVEGTSLDYSIYHNWINTLKRNLAPYSKVAKSLETKYSLTILKLVDEALYIMCSAKLKKRVNELGYSWETLERWMRFFSFGTVSGN